MVRKRLNASLLAWLLAMSAMAPVNGAELAIDDGVVVKFGPGAQLVVRDKASLGKGVLLTSAKDDTAAGSLDGQAHTAQAGDWSGVRLEKSAAAYGFSVNDSTLRYAGGNNAAALLVRGFNPTLTYLHVWDSTLGLQLQEGAAPAVSGGSFLRNTVAVQSTDNGHASFTGSDFTGNGTAINNLTPATVLGATGNWWGDATGPQDPVNNPAGLGSPVSTGVDYAGWSTVLPLINPQIALAGSSNYSTQANVQLTLACQNAVEYRIAENGNFSGIDFKPMAASVSYTLSSGDGSKSLSVQYRASTGNTVTIALASPVILDTVPPTVSISNPAAGSFLSKAISIDAGASDTSGIQQVDFYVDNTLKTSDTTSPYSYAWDVTAETDGDHVIKVVATDKAGRTNAIQETVTKGVPPPDVTGPVISEFKLGSTAIIDGAVLAQSGSLTLSASDPSGVASTEFGLDGVKLASASLDLYGIADGAHTVYAKATDSVGNTTTSTYNVTVALAAPATAPSITSPTNGLQTSQAQQTVAGSAALQTQVQVYINGVSSGAAVAVDSSGKFAAPVTLVSGSNAITVAAVNRGGSSPQSAAVTVTLDASVPTPPSGLVAQAQTGGKVRLSWLKSGDSATTGYQVYRSSVSFNSVSEAVKLSTLTATTTSYDDLPANDGTYYYRVVGVNALGTQSAPTNLASGTADSTPPHATSIVYEPTGSYDAASATFGRGRVNVTLNTSEALLTTPFLSIAPQNGTPISVLLTKVNDTQYTGYFDIGSSTPTGTAWALFSAYDVIGNRGTDVDAGQSIKIDAQGPSVTGITLTPPSPILTNNTNPVTVNAVFALSEAVKSGTQPAISWQLSGTNRPLVPLSGLSQVDGLTWQAQFTLPADAGQTATEYLHFTYQGADALDNSSTVITAINSYEVYQGNLAPAPTPTGLTATAQTGGKVQLAWNSVTDAAAYELYRQAPGDAAPAAYQRLTVTSYTDSTTADGNYIYSVASVRSYNGQESLSDPSSSVSVNADSTAPDAPQSLSLTLLSTGVNASWLPPASGAYTYNLYRSSAGTITTLVGLTPIKTGITQTSYTDANPSQTDHSYVVTAVDAAGNESDISNSAYLNFGLLPVNSINIAQTNGGLPVVSWTYNTTAISGFDFYVGPDSSAIKLNDALLTAKVYTDTGYNGNERRYTIVAVDSNNQTAARSLTLPKVSMQLPAGTVLRRGVMNRLTWTVKNEGESTLYGAHLKFTVAGHDHVSSSFSLSPGQSLSVPVIVGGYPELSNPAAATLSLIAEPNAGELIQISSDSSMEVQDGSLTVGQTTATFTRGGTGQASFTLSNTSDVDIEILTATGNGNQPSTEMRYKLIDADGNVLATQSFKQALGGNVITLNNGQTVARVSAGTSFTSDPVAIVIPASAPDQVYVQLEIDKLHYHTGQPDQVDISGMTNRKTVVLTDTAYNGTVDALSPASSFGDQAVIMSGQAIDRKTGLPVANVPLTLAFDISNFERKFDIQTDTSGAWRYTYMPQPTDAGTYKVSAVHPSLLDRPGDRSFTINRLTVAPSQIKLSTSRNYNQLINLTATTGESSQATNVHLAYDPASQLTGALPAGITVNLSNPVTLGPKQSVTIPLSISGNNDAAATGTVILDVYLDEFGNVPFGKIRIDYTLSESKPSMSVTPGNIVSGSTQGGSTTEHFTIKNNGLADAVNMKAVLANAPSWAAMTTPTDIGTVGVGASRTVELMMTPPADLPEGIYNFTVNLSGDNVPQLPYQVSVSVTQSGQGGILFKAEDIYTGIPDKNGVYSEGVTGAHITVQNELVPSIVFTQNTDSHGETTFSNLPAGNYKFRASATNHQDVSGRFTIKPGVTLAQAVFMEYNLISVEWSVKEITVEDRYEITLNTTYETDVPAAVVVMKPGVVNLPDMKAGDVFNGELTLTNYGLIRADNVTSHLPTSDSYIRYEFLSEIPASLEAKQVFVLPYRAVALQSFTTDGTTTGGGTCFNYSNGGGVSYDYSCANGHTSSGSSGVTWTRNVGSCGGGTNGGTSAPIYGYYGDTGTGGGSGGWSNVTAAPSYTSMAGAQCIPACPYCNPGNGK